MLKKTTLLTALMLFTLIAGAVGATGPSPQEGGQAYTVQAGDWLSKIAEKYYGDMNAWPAIVEATNARAAEDNSFARITDPGVIEVGQKLWIPDAAATQQATISTTEQLTPILASVLIPPTPVKLTDGLFHLVYELKVTNVTGGEASIEALEVLDPQNSDAVVARLSGDDVAANLYLPGATAPTATLGPAQAGLIFVNLTFPSLDKVPRALDHVISGIPASERVARTQVMSGPPVVIGPPVEGDHWIIVAVLGDSYHRRTVLPVNGEWYISQRFAGDWIQTDDENHLVTGDPAKNESYPQFGQNLLAVADGVVVKTLDGLPDVTPGAKPTGLTIEEVGGNHVILEIGNGIFAYYAHMKQGSVAVREGERVRRGQVLGLLGNSGNTDGPHLHLHIMDGPLPLASNGIPYVIDSFKLKGRAVSADNLATELMTNAPVVVQPVEEIDLRENEMPANLTLVEFPTASAEQARFTDPLPTAPL
jgi:hypothetical protein